MSNIHNDFMDADGVIQTDAELSVECHYAPLENIFITEGANYLRVECDAGATNIETRIPFDAIKKIAAYIAEIEAGVK